MPFPPSKEPIELLPFFCTPNLTALSTQIGLSYVDLNTPNTLRRFEFILVSKQPGLNCSQNTSTIELDDRTRCSAPHIVYTACNVIGDPPVPFFIHCRSLDGALLRIVLAVLTPKLSFFLPLLFFCHVTDSVFLKTPHPLPFTCFVPPFLLPAFSFCDIVVLLCLSAGRHNVSAGSGRVRTHFPYLLQLSSRNVPASAYKLRLSINPSF